MEDNFEHSNQGSNIKKRLDKKKKDKKYIIILGILLIAFFVVIFVSTNQFLDTKHSFSKNTVSSNHKDKNEDLNDEENEETNKSDEVIDDKELDEPVIEEPVVEKNPVEEKLVVDQGVWQIADESYFQDAIFVGDSRTEGFMINNGIMATIGSYTHKGLTVDTIFTSKVINRNGEKITIMDALRGSQFSKVYLMLGINETGWPYNEVFISHYARIIDEIRNINPNCIIYVQSVIPVSEKVSNEHPYVKNSKINDYNSLLQKMSLEKQVYYLNVAEALVNEAGFLPEDAALDGIHLNQAYCVKWFDYLKNHVIGG